MFNFIAGTVIRKNKNVVTVKCGGIGYEVILSLMHAMSVSEGKDTELVLHTQVREDALELYGFRDFDELDFFRLLISVSGVGPKSAIHILSLGSIQEIKDAISAEDLTYLVKVSGIGKKTAERIVVDLKDKVKSNEQKSVSASGAVGEIFDALIALGYKRQEIQEIIKDAAGGGESTEEALKKALRLLSKH